MTESTLTSEHLDPTTEISLDTVKKRSIKGIAVLTGRTLILNAISFFAQTLLWLFIEPSEYGIFLLVSATVNFLSYFADIGLGAALIQKKDKPLDEDYQTVFLVQEALVISIVILVFVLSPVLMRTHSLSSDARNLLYALNISFFLASLKNIPSIMLERKLEFGKFVIPQVLENVIYSTTLVYFAWKGFGITSFTYAVLLRGIFGVIAIYIIQPWKVGFGFSKKSLHGLLRYGIPYQFNSFLATIKDDGMTIVLGGILGSFGLGILGTAQKLSQYPLRFFMDNVNKVTFPAFSRMQDDKEDLIRSLTRSIFFICVLVFPTLVGLCVLFPVLIIVIPKYQKWQPAYIPLIFFSINSMWAAVTTQITNVLASIGKIKIVVKLMIMWTSLSWLLIPFLSKVWGLNGAAAGYAIVASSSFIAFIVLKRIINWSIKDSALNPLIASAIMGLVIYVFKNLFSKYDIVTFIALTLLGILVYGVTLNFLVGKSLVQDVKKIFAQFSQK